MAPVELISCLCSYRIMGMVEMICIACTTTVWVCHFCMQMPTKECLILHLALCTQVNLLITSTFYPFSATSPKIFLLMERPVLREVEWRKEPENNFGENLSDPKFWSLHKIDSTESSHHPLPFPGTKRGILPHTSLLPSFLCGQKPISILLPRKNKDESVVLPSFHSQLNGISWAKQIHPFLAGALCV